MGYDFRRHLIRVFGVRCSYLCKLICNFDWPLITASVVVLLLTILTYQFVSGFREQVEQNFLSVEANIVESPGMGTPETKGTLPERWGITGRILCNGFPCIEEDESSTDEFNRINVSAEFTDRDNNQYYGVVDALDMGSGTFKISFVQPPRIEIVNVSVVVNYQKEDDWFLPLKKRTAVWRWAPPGESVQWFERRYPFDRGHQSDLSAVATPLIPLLLVFSLSILVGLFQLNTTEKGIYRFPFRQLLSFKYYMSILLAMMFSALMIYSIVILMQSFSNSERTMSHRGADRVTSLGFAYVFNGRYAEKATDDWILSLTRPEEELSQERQQRWRVGRLDVGQGNRQKFAKGNPYFKAMDNAQPGNATTRIGGRIDHRMDGKTAPQSDEAPTENVTSEGEGASAPADSGKWESAGKENGKSDGQTAGESGETSAPTETNEASDAGENAESPISRGFGAPLWVILISVLGSAIFTIQLLVNSLKDAVRFDDMLNVDFREAAKKNASSCSNVSAAESAQKDENASDTVCIRWHVRKRVKMIIQHQFYILFSPLGAIFVYQILVSSDSIGHPATVGIAAFSAGFAINNLLRKALSVSEDLLDTANQKPVPAQKK
jgi:uncharacterized membrane protein